MNQWNVEVKINGKWIVIAKLVSRSYAFNVYARKCMEKIECRIVNGLV